MSLKAIDSQMIIHKTGEISRLQKLEQQQGQQLQDNVMLQIRKDSAKNQASVGRISHTEQNKIDNQASQKQKGNEEKEKKDLFPTEELKNDDEELNLEKHLGSIFDLRI